MSNPTFSVIEYSSFFAVRHNPSGKEVPMGDGVDTLFNVDGEVSTPGSHGFVEAWEASLNDWESETLEAYFPELIEPDGLDEMVSAYVECALWSSHEYDENGNDGKSFGAGDNGRETDDDCLFLTIDDLSPETLTACKDDCCAFLRDHATIIGDRYTEAGHDFWLTRNRHGAGFWDGDWPDADGKVLTDDAHVYGSVDLYVGDDGKVYGN